MVDDIKKEHEQQVENLENNDGLMPGLKLKKLTEYF